MSVFAYPPTIPCARETFLMRSAPRFNVGTLSVFSSFGDNVYDAIDRVRTPNRGTRSADDFDPFNILE